MKNWEKKEYLWELVEKHQEELLQICSELIQIPSANWKGIEESLRYCCGFLEALGVSYQVLRPCGEIPCIVAEVGKPDGNFGILNGHLDVVEPGDLSRWSYDPYCGTITDTQILGRGASDMKCGCGVLLFLFKLIVEENLDLQGRLVLHLVNDEEQGSEQGSKWLIENGYADGAEFCIITEPTSHDSIEIGQKGRARLLLRTSGSLNDGGIIKDAKESAIHKMIHILSRIQELTLLEGTVTEAEQRIVEASQGIIQGAMNHQGVGGAINHVNVNILSIDGGPSSAMTSELCEARLALGVPFMISKEQVHEKLLEIIRESGAECEIEYLSWDSGARTDGNEALVHSVRNNAERITGRTMTPTYQWATSDAKYYRSHGIPTIQFGPSNNKGIHSHNEDVEISDVIKCAKTHLAVLEDMLGFQIDAYHTDHKASGTH